jgi:hypothetical protein
MDAMRQLEQITDGFVREIRGDYVGLWEIASAIRHRLGISDNREVKKIALLIVRRLFEHDIRPGDYVHPAFKFWRERDADSIIARIDREWDPKRGDPNLGEPICWFDALPGTAAYADHRMRHA